MASYEFDNIMNLAKAHEYHKIMVMRNTWTFGSWAIVNRLELDARGYGRAFGYIHYRNGNTSNGEISCAGCFQWRVVKILDETMKVSSCTSEAVSAD